MTKTLYDPVVKEEGIKEGIYKVAKALLDVLDDGMIAEKTGLSKDEVARLRQGQQEEGPSTTLAH